MKILALVSQKGGVSKSTSCVNLAACFAEWGLRVLLGDLDPQAALTISSLTADLMKALEDPQETFYNMYHVFMGEKSLKEIILSTTIPHVALAPSDIELAGVEAMLLGQPGWDRILKQELDTVANEYDIVLLDSPQSLGILSQSAILAADVVLVPLQCEYLALRALRQLMRIIQRTIQRVKPNIHLVVFRTMYDARTTHAKDASAEIARIGGNRLLKTVIHRATDLQKATAVRQSILAYARNSRAASQYRALAKEVLDYAERTTSGE